ncbi:VOC family protein [Deinococcus cellulosilyticus]|uniref:ChaP protein n=1 Tax=Deinococcus cellulosilyticus (strain DSM 18568 / NBRC 106333 / KACC 11606 / 5516J-15) TaxID=1223518 RepID=A0A511N661_DEIC1|nr:VOC family protein [Deinococcus cellulosilyticus]GEM48335.1 chaP protein [Deinococcus cellulosilyticus NBRC 106333 = KACC 11606]
MTIRFNHSIIAARDRTVSAAFYARVLGLPEPTTWGPFSFVMLDDHAHLQFATVPEGADIHMQHYAFLVDDESFDQIYERLLHAGLEQWADPQMQFSGQINTNHGGRGVYFKDPAGHGLEVITRPYEM